jgi:hypothetical protein
MSTLKLATVSPLPLRARAPVLLAPDVRGCFARERAASRPITSGSGRSIEDAVLSLLESDLEREARLLGPAEAA